MQVANLSGAAAPEVNALFSPRLTMKSAYRGLLRELIRSVRRFWISQLYWLFLIMFYRPLDRMW